MYSLTRTIHFARQYDELDEDTCRVIEQKLQMAQSNPAQFKRVCHPGLLLFSIRFSDRRKAKRLVFCVDGNVIKVLFILDRGKNYDDLDKWLRTVGQ